MLDRGEGTGRCRQSGVSVSHTARPCRGLGEREIRDMYGLIPVGLPDQRRRVAR